MTLKRAKHALRVKADFGRRFRAARDARRISRASLAVRLGISPKTIQSWEMGRTWIEDLDLIPAVNAELGISVFGMMEQILEPEKAALAASAASPAANAPPRAAEPAAPYSARNAAPRPGPLAPEVRILHAGPGEMPESELLSAWVSVPLVSPAGVVKPVSALTQRDIAGQVLIPGAWCTRGGVLVACRMGDSGMMPMIPLGATVVLDRRPGAVDKRIGRVVALNFAGKGLRIRYLMREGEHLVGATTADNQRGKMIFRPDKGDELLGRVVGVLSEVY